MASAVGLNRGHHDASPPGQLGQPAGELEAVPIGQSDVHQRRLGLRLVSSNTVRAQLRHIRAKLGAHSRTEAAARARQLGLLAPVRRLS